MTQKEEMEKELKKLNKNIIQHVVERKVPIMTKVKALEKVEFILNNEITALIDPSIIDDFKNTKQRLEHSIRTGR